MTARSRRRMATGLGLAVALAAALLAVTSAGAGTAHGERKVIGEAGSNGLRVTVTALRVDRPNGEPPAATVRVAAFERSAGEWKRLGGALTVGEKGSWFWAVVTRPYGVRKLVLARASGAAFPDRIGLQLLTSPAIGPSGTFRFTVEDGKLVAVDV
jgi:hypothetical protein